MVQSSVCIDLYLECADQRIYTWNEVKEFAAKSRKFRSASDEEVYDVYIELNKNYGHRKQ